MRISPIKSSTNFSKPAFKGYTIEGYGYRHGHLHAAENSGRRIEKTLGGFHNDITGKIYYTDPLEKVNDNLREMVDYVVYDDEPKFPDINNEVSKLSSTMPWSTSSASRRSPRPWAASTWTSPRPR